MLIGEESVPHDRLLASEFYNDFLRHMNVFHGLGGLIRRDGNRAVLLGVHRPRRRDGFDYADRDLMQALFAHFQRAVELSRCMGLVEARANAGWLALDLMPQGIIALDARGRTILANRRAEAILAAADGLEEGRPGLGAADRAHTARLRRLIATAPAEVDVDGPPPGWTLRLPRPSGKPAYEVLVLPAPVAQLPDRLGDELAGVRVLLFISSASGRPGLRQKGSGSFTASLRPKPALPLRLPPAVR